MDIGAIKSRVSEIPFPQGTSEALPQLPLRCLTAGNSGSGKTNMISTLITDPRFFRGKWTKVFWLSPTALIDDALQPVRDFVDDHLEQDQQKEPTFHDHFNVPFLTKVIGRARRVMEWMKEQKPRPKKAFNTLIVLDDLGDTNDPAALKLINLLFLKARHWGISTILSVQRLKLPLMTVAARTNATCVICYKLRNQNDLMEGLLYEYSALAPKEKIMAAYRAAVDRPFGFLVIKTNAQDPNRMFMNGFKSYFRMIDKDDQVTARSDKAANSSSQAARRASLEEAYSDDEEGPPGGKNVRRGAQGSNAPGR